MNRDILRRRSASQHRIRPSRVAHNVVHRTCSCGGTCGDCRKEREQGVHRRAARSGDVERVPEVVHETLATPGQALDASSRELFESRFGQDFSGVHVHADPRAADSAAVVNALAYTVGRDIVFAAGQYSPCTGVGQELLAHELAHVVQDGDHDADRPTAISKRNDPAERSADALAASALGAHGDSAHAGKQSGSGVLHRQEALDQSQKSKDKEAQLRRLAWRPGIALERWSSLSAKDRDTVVTLMGERYSDWFAKDFTQYASGKKKPHISTDVVTSQPDPKSMQTKGYRYFGDPGGVPLWVHPSGHEIQVIAGVKQEPPPADCEAAATKCATLTEDSETCEACCSGEPEECMSHCKTRCAYKDD